MFEKTSQMKEITPIHHRRGQNGRVYLVTYRDGKKALLKMPKTQYNDNLMYEYLVGKHFTNHAGSLFVKTYALFRHRGPCNDDEPVDLTPKPKDLDLVSVSSANYHEFCNCNQNFALLTEYIENARTLEDYLHQIRYDRNVTLSILKRIYDKLTQVYPSFVHNDLTLVNVLINQSGFSKIIDFGRSYFHVDENSSENLHMQVMEYCRNYGKENGFGDIWNVPNFKTEQTFMNRCIQRKPSLHGCPTCRDTADLRLLFDLNEKYPHHDDLKALLENIQPTMNLMTRECVDKKATDHHKITTIKEARQALYALEATPKLNMESLLFPLRTRTSRLLVGGGTTRRRKRLSWQQKTIKSLPTKEEKVVFVFYTFANAGSLPYSSWTYNKLPTGWWWVGAGSTASLPKDTTTAVKRAILYKREEQFKGPENTQAQTMQYLNTVFTKLKKDGVIARFQLRRSYLP